MEDVDPPSDRPSDPSSATPARLARTVDGRPLLGGEDGFVPLASAGIDSVADALGAAASAGGLPAVETLPAAPTPAEHLAFGTPFDPGKLWGIGLNYADHADDLDAVRPAEPASFMQPATALTAPGGPIRLPPSDETSRVTAEAELGVVIGRTCKGVDRDAFGEVVAGVVAVIDVTAEDVLQRNPRFLTRAKSYDTFLVVGPWVSTPMPLDRLAGTTVRTVINGVTVAENTVDRMLFPPEELVSFHSRVMTLETGDLISTGTPGAGVITAGDTVRAEIDGVGALAADVIGGA
ncbi:fumarylacetoacetate (FAA) hydrolase [Halorubrum aidingense JCM 13560]|uniref:Fumarylacetoacetate (FAA) hydrolase n=1 Tax=Halorubrum aidingense JCM 13560 TaxID=1230454 RepID=M0PB77_9EURY|nr:fumarylacetoacetate hydrolase family protein [Halorubrum aidingense]EMA66804.1 fumarylacetoacetate (FAA) hydrolase [Halorubrum aidingense JCM 13560]